MAKKRILVADDDLLTREIVAKLLREEGYDVALATDGQEAILLVSTYKISVLLPLWHPLCGLLKVLLLRG